MARTCKTSIGCSNANCVYRDWMSQTCGLRWSNVGGGRIVISSSYKTNFVILHIFRMWVLCDVKILMPEILESRGAHKKDECNHHIHSSFISQEINSCIAFAFQAFYLNVIPSNVTKKRSMHHAKAQHYFADTTQLESIGPPTLPKT